MDPACYRAAISVVAGASRREAGIEEATGNRPSKRAASSSNRRIALETKEQAGRHGLDAGHALAARAHVFLEADAQALGSVVAADAQSFLVVISHDCDIANINLEEEPEVEFIVASRGDRLDGNLTHAKHPRRLHSIPPERRGYLRRASCCATETRSIAVLERYAPDRRFALTKQIAASSRVGCRLDIGSKRAARWLGGEITTGAPTH